MQPPDEVRVLPSLPTGVLLVEDDPTNQLFAQRILTKRGFRVVLAENGRLALSALARERFDLVLMDLQMPDMSGLDVAIAVRAGEVGTGRHVPIVALTAHAAKSDAEACLAAGMDAHIAKPFRAAKLLEVIQHLLGDDIAPAPQAPQAPQAQAGRPAVDRARLINNAEGEIDLLAELVGLFPIEVAAQLAALKSAIHVGDAALLTWTAHRLKGALGTYGARVAVESAARLEQIGAAGDLTDAAREAAVLEGELRRAQAELGELETAIEGCRQSGEPLPF